MLRVCKKCGIEKPLEDFTKSTIMKLGRVHTCRNCKNDYQRSHFKSKGISCIYKLTFIDDAEMFYVGQTKNLYRRKMAHLHMDKIDGANTLLHNYFRLSNKNIKIDILKKCHPDHLQFWEQYYISELNPPLNSFRFSSSDKNPNLKNYLRRDGVKFDLFNIESNLLSYPLESFNIIHI